VGKVALEGPAKKAEGEGPREITPEFVDNLLKGDDVLATDAEFGGVVRDAFGLGSRKRKSERDLQTQAALTDLLSTPEKRVALAKKLAQERADLKGEPLPTNAMWAIVRKAAKAGEADIGRKFDEGVVEKAAAETPGPVGKIEGPPKKIVGHYDYIKDQIDREGSELQQAGVKSVAQLVEQLPLEQQFKPHEVKAYRDYVKARDEGKTHAQALDFVRSEQKSRWSSNQAASTPINLILKQARELQQKKLTAAGEGTGKLEASHDQVAELAREKQSIQTHIREAIVSGDKDELSTALGAFLAHIKRRQLYDLKRIDLKELKALAKGLPEREGARPIPASAYKNAEALIEAIARHEGVVVKDLKPKMEAKLGEALPEAVAQVRAPTKKATGLPAGPGGFEAMPTRPNEPGGRYKGRNGVVVSFVKTDGTVKIERVPEGVELPALKEDLAALRNDPDVKRIDLHDDLPIKATDGILDPREGELPEFVADPDPPKNPRTGEPIDRLIRMDPEQSRLAEMVAREIYGIPPSWMAPGRASDTDVLATSWFPKAKEALVKPEVAKEINAKLVAAGIKGAKAVKDIGAGTYHVVFDLQGAKDAKGREYVLRVGKAPYLQLETDAQRALEAPVIAHGKLTEGLAPLFYTVHPKAIVGPRLLWETPIASIDQTGHLTATLEKLEPLDPLPRTTYDQRLHDKVWLQSVMDGDLPQGISLQEAMEDMDRLFTKAVYSGLSVARDFQSAQGFGPRAQQFGYIPVDNLNTLGVGRMGGPSMKQAYQLVAIDRGLLTPLDPKNPVWGDMPRQNRLALQSSKPVSRLSLGEQMRQLEHYDEDVRDAEPIGEGEGLFVANHDRVATGSHVSKLGEQGAPIAGALQKITDDVVSTINDQYDVPAEGKLNVVYRGITASPHLSGLYHERLGGGVADPAHIYSNPLEAIAASADRESAIDRMLYTVLHEVSHNKFKGHGASHQTMEEYIKNLLVAQEKFGEYQKQLREAFTQEHYDRMQHDLLPEYLRMRRDHVNRTSSSWRDRPLGELPARDLEGGAKAVSDRLGGGEEGATGDLAVGLRPGEAVPGGGRGQTGGVRPAAAAGEPLAAAPAQGEAARPAAGRDPVEEATARLAEWGVKGVNNEQEAKALIHQLVESSAKLGKPVTHDQLHEWGWETAGHLVSLMHPKDIADRANSLPSPTKSGQMVGPINMLHYVDLPVESKARIQIWGELTKGLWPKDTPQRWEQVNKEVQNMLALHTPEQWAYHYRNQGGGPSAKDLLMMRIVSNELAQKVDRAESVLHEALAKAGTTPEEIEKLQHAVNNANRQAVEGGLMMAGGGTKAGRALAILRKDIRDLDPQIAFQQDFLAGLRERTQTRFKGDKAKAEATAQALFNEFMKIRETNGDWGEFAKAYRAMLGSKLWPEKILEFYKAGLLGWPSRVANMTSNGLLRGVRMLEDTVAAGIDLAHSKLTGEKRELFIGEGTVSALALRRAWSESIPEWWGEMKRHAMLQPDDFVKSLKKGSIMEDLLQSGGAIEGKKGEFLRFHLKGMGADDALMKHFIRTDSLYRQIYRKVRQGDKQFQMIGKETHAQATERIFSDLRTNWQKAIDGSPQYDFVKLRQFEPMRKEAEATARRETFQEELGGAAKGFQKYLRDYPFLQIFIPFYRTPLNITKETLTRTPLGMFGLAKKWKGLSTAQKISEASRPLTGTALGMGALAYAMTGQATGGGPLDPDERSMLESTGWQPYSAKIGDQYISYQRLEPMASILGVAADAAEGIRNGDFQSARTGILRVMQSAAENVTNKTFLSGLDALTSAISHPNQFMNSFVKRMQSSMIPNSLGFVPVSGLTRALDRTYRQTDPMSMSTFYAKLPFLSSTLEPQYSPSGEERQRPGTALEQIISPFARVKLESGAARVGAEEVVRLSASPKAPRRYWIAPGGLRVDFLPEERKSMAQSMQSATKFIGERLIRDPNYLALPDNELDPKFRFGGKTKETVIKNVYGRYRDQVMQRIKPSLVGRAKKTLRERNG
jgi:hypothetical protein